MIIDAFFGKVLVFAAFNGFVLSLSLVTRFHPPKTPMAPADADATRQS